MITATKPLATIDGVMLTPGVSKNNRLYTRDAIGRAVARMRERLQDPVGLPIVMRTHHDAGDNSRLIVGRITDISQQPDGSAAYKAHLFNTTAGRDIGTLIDPKAPALKATSIHGYWIGPVERHRQGADTIESGSDLEVDAIDFTASPGVTGAQIRKVAFESVAPDAGGREEITESGEATVTLVSEANTEAEGSITAHLLAIAEKYSAAQQRQMLDKGHALPNAKGKPSYTIGSKADLRKAIKAVGRGGADHDKIRAYIVDRAKALGLSAMVPDNWNADGSLKETAPVSVATPAVDEAYVLVCVGDDSGPLVSVRSSNVDPGDVKKAARQAAKIAARALKNAPDEPAPAEPDDSGTYDTAYSGETHTREGTVAQTWTVSVNGKEMDADEAKAVVAAAISEAAPKTPASAVEPAPTPAAAPAVVEQKEVAVSDAKVVEQATPTPTAPAAADLSALITAAVTAAVAEALPKAVKKALKERKPDKASQVAVQQAAAPAVTAQAATATTETAPVTPTATAESTTKAGTTQVTEAAPAQVGITAAQLEEKLTAERAKTIAEVRTQLLNENGVPGRKGYRINETTDDSEKLTGDDLWNRRSEVWGPMFPSQMSPAPVPVPVAADAAAA